MGCCNCYIISEAQLYPSLGNMIVVLFFNAGQIKLQKYDRSVNF